MLLCGGGDLQRESGLETLWGQREDGVEVTARELNLGGRQWPEVYDLCNTFLKRVRFSHGRVLFDSRNVQKRATKSDTSGHCLLGGT